MPGSSSALVHRRSTVRRAPDGLPPRRDPLRGRTSATIADARPIRGRGRTGLTRPARCAARRSRRESCSTIFTQSSTSADRQRPRRPPRSGRRSAICSSEYFVTAAPTSQIASTSDDHRRRRRRRLSRHRVRPRYACGYPSAWREATRTTPRATTTCSSSSATGSVRRARLRGAGHRGRGAGSASWRRTTSTRTRSPTSSSSPADGRIAERASGLGQYLVRHWERVGARRGRVARLLAAQARLPRRVPRPPRQGGPARRRLGRRHGRVRLREPEGGRPLLELAPVPSWHEVQFAS